VNTIFRLNFQALLLVIIFSLSFFSFDAVFASSSNWVEVTRFTGSGTTDYFTSEHVEWRIRWEFTPNPLGHAFSVLVFEKEGDSPSIEQILQTTQDNETSGVTYMHNKKGTFYMSITTAGIMDFTIIVEQDVNSIPEFPTWIIAPLFIITALATITCKRQMMKNTKFYDEHMQSKE